MAAKGIKGITIKIGGDATGLDKALRGVNSQIRQTQSDLKDVEKALKIDPGNIELLEQKQRALGDAVKATKEKLDTLKTAQQQAAEQLARGDIGQEQYDALTGEIVKAEDALKKATEAASNFNVEAEQMKAKLSGVSEAAGKVEAATKKVSTAAAGVVAGLGAMAIKSAASADELNTMAKQSGLTTDELQRMQYASELVDVGLDTMVGAQSKLRKSMAGSGDAFKKLGVQIKMSNGEVRDSSDVFYEVLDALSRVQNETERDQLAMEIFGKSADQLAGIIDDGGAALKAYGDEAAELGLILDQETLDGLNSVNDEIDKLKAQASAQLAKASASALQALTPVIEDVINALSGVFEAIGKLSPAAIEAIAIVATVVAAISPVAGAISKITGAIAGPGGLLETWPQIAAAGKALLGFIAGHPVLIIIAAIAALVAVIIKHWDEIRPVLEAIWAKVQEIVGKVIDKLKGAYASIRETFANIKNSVVTTFTNIRDTIVDKFNSIRDKVIGAWEAVRDGIVGVFTGIVDAVKTKINSVIDLANSLIDKVNSVAQAINNSGIGSALGVNIGTIGNISKLETSSSQGAALLSQNGAGGGSSSYNTYNTSNVYNQTSSQPLSVNLNLDGQTLARQMVQPMRAANAAAGNSNMR